MKAVQELGMSAAHKVVFIGEYRFPEGDAAAIRTLSLARIWRDLGYDVMVIGKGTPRPSDFDAQRGGYYLDGIRYSTMAGSELSMGEKVRRLLDRLTLYRSELRAQNLAPGSVVVINACSSARHVPFVRAFAKQHGLKLVADTCEWYDPRQFRYGRFDPSYLIFWAVFRFVFPRIANLIVVSRLLERRFSGGGRNVIRVMAPFDLQEIPYADRTPKDRLLLVYAGVPGRKDQLRELILAISDLPPALRARIEFRLLGPTQQDLETLLGSSAGVLASLDGIVRPLGRVPRRNVLDAFQEVHFTVLFRPDERYAHAGFPSKVAESLAAGAPLLLNLTSDLAECLGDGTAAIIVDEVNRTTIVRALERALSLSPSELGAFRRAAREKAERLFDYRGYVEPFSRYVEHLD